jgi:hypothetical protein
MRNALPLFVLHCVLALAASMRPAEAAEPQPGTGGGGAPELAIVLLSPEPVVSANFPDAEEFSSWLNPVLDACRHALAAEKKPPALVVQISLRKNGDPVFELAGKPALSSSLTKRLRTALAALPRLRSPVSDLALRIQTPAQTNDPVKEATAFTPRLRTPDEVADAAFAQADLAGKLVLLRTWAREHGLPLLVHAAERVDERFVGVRNTGRVVRALDWSAPVSVEQQLYSNPDFWRGIVEMAPGNQLIGALPAMVFAANGEIDPAGTLSGLLVQFSMEDTLARVVLLRLRQRISAFNQQLNAEINRGIKLHERKQYDRAIAVYQKVLAAYPRSAWARYEIFFSTATKRGLTKGLGLAENSNALWEEAAAEIYQINPLYEVQFAGTRGSTMGAMFDRLTLRTMGAKAIDDPGERFGTIAEVAMHLGAYGQAAQVYWVLLHTKFGPKTRIMPANEASPLTTNDVLARFLYCVEQLGVTSLKENFQGDFPEEFAVIERELANWRSQ